LLRTQPAGTTALDREDHQWRCDRSLSSHKVASTNHTLRCQLFCQPDSASKTVAPANYPAPYHGTPAPHRTHHIGCTSSHNPSEAELNQDKISKCKVSTAAALSRQPAHGYPGCGSSRPSAYMCLIKRPSSLVTHRSTFSSFIIHHPSSVNHQYFAGAGQGYPFVKIQVMKCATCSLPYLIFRVTRKKKKKKPSVGAISMP
jgi:hypothetical protein